MDIDQSDARLTMVFDDCWKYVHVETLRSMLFDLQTDPGEVVDLAPDPAYSAELSRLADAHFTWTLRHHTLMTRSAKQVDAKASQQDPPGVIIAF